MSSACFIKWKLGLRLKSYFAEQKKKAGVEYLYDIKNVLSALCSLTFALFGLAKIWLNTSSLPR